MLTYLEDTSLFDSPAQTLVNTVNTVGVMGKGIAAEFKRRYPQMFKEYRGLCLSSKLGIGKLHIYRTPNKTIVNFPTKRHWREQSQVDYLEKGLKKFTSFYMDYGVSSVSFPQLGCGNGELEWADVQPVMEKYLEQLPIPVYIHLYPTPEGFLPERLDPTYAEEVLEERQSISLEMVLRDLSELIAGWHSRQGELTLFSSKASLSSDRIEVTLSSGQMAQVYHENIANLWNSLLIARTISLDDVRNELQSDELSEWFMELVSQLPYLKPVKLRLRNSSNHQTGLRYQPPAGQLKRKTPEIIL